MKITVLYDSVFGNTEKIAFAVAGVLGEGVKLVKAETAFAEGVGEFDLLIVGSPTYGGRPTKSVEKALNMIAGTGMEGKYFACFDTRLSLKVLGIFGFASERISALLRAKGATELLKPAGFVVNGTEGPLKEGEIERAMTWARDITLKVREEE